MKVTTDEIVEALHFCRSMGAWAEKSCDLADRIQAHGIEQPSDGRKPIAWEVETKAYGKGYSFSEEFFEAFPRFPCTSMLDALIAEIDGLCGVAAPFATEADGLWVDADELKAITDKYRGQK